MQQYDSSPRAGAAAEAVRRLLSTVENGALGPGVQALLVEACLFLADVHGARRALEGLPGEVARPWSAWLRVMDRAPEQEIDLPRRTDIRYPQTRREDAT